MIPSFLQNCYIEGRPGDGPLFTAYDDTITAHLNGYAIIPREVYDHLRELAEAKADEMAIEALNKAKNT